MFSFHGQSSVQCPALLSNLLFYCRALLGQINNYDDDDDAEESKDKMLCICCGLSIFYGLVAELADSCFGLSVDFRFVADLL